MISQIPPNIFPSQSKSTSTLIAIGLAGVVIEYFGILVIFYIAAASIFVTALLASTNKYIKEL